MLAKHIVGINNSKVSSTGGKNFMTTVKNNASLFSVFEMYHEGPSDWPKAGRVSHIQKTLIHMRSKAVYRWEIWLDFR